jgi:hypothetical protein
MIDTMNEFFWKYFFLYTIAASVMFAYTQLSMNHEFIAELWATGEHTSGASRTSIGIGIMQDLFIPAIILAMLYQSRKRLRSNERKYRQ